VLEEYFEAASAYQKKARRPEFLRMLQRAKDDPEVTTVLVHDFSRFSRDSMNCRMLIRQLRERGVEVVSVSDPMFDPESVTGVYMEAITFARTRRTPRRSLSTPERAAGPTSRPATPRWGGATRTVGSHSGATGPSVSSGRSTGEAHLEMHLGAGRHTRRWSPSLRVGPRSAGDGLGGRHAG